MTVSIPKWVLAVLLVLVAAGAGAGAALLLNKGNDSTPPSAATTTTAVARTSSTATGLTTVSASDDAYLDCAKQLEVWLGKPNAAKPKCHPGHNGNFTKTVTNVLQHHGVTLGTKIPSQGETVALYLNEMTALENSSGFKGPFNNASVYKRLAKQLPP